MAKKSQTNSKSTLKVSYHCKPDNLTLEQWQMALRRQVAAKEVYSISEKGMKDYPGYYTVSNFVTKNDYTVVYRGDESEWNYCSCMDFKTSRLGTCKHIEAVKLWIEKNGRRVCRRIPSYTSMYLSYKGERQVCLRIGPIIQKSSVGWRLLILLPKE